MTVSVRRWRESNVQPHSYYEWPRQMPRIPDVHLQGVVFIYPSAETANAGERVGGSGFVTDMYSGVGPWRVRYVVTNKHVVDGGGHWVRVNHPQGTETVHVPPDEWIHAPGDDDICIALLSLPDHVTPYHLSMDAFAVTPDVIGELRVGPGDEVYMVGRLLGHGGRVTNNPIARFGNIALMPSATELVRDGRENDVEAYLVEMRSHSGFSGSPVFLLIPQNSFRGAFGDRSMDDHTDRFRLLGIDTGHKVECLPVLQKDGHGDWDERDDLLAWHQTDIAIVAPAWKILDLLNREDLVAERLEIGTDLQLRRGTEQAVADASDQSSNPAIS